MLAQLLEVLPRELLHPWEGLRKRASSGVPTYPATEEAMQLALHLRSTFLDMSLSTTVRTLPRSALELRRTR